MSTSARSLIGQAADDTGLTDFGPDGWQEGVDRLLAAATADLGGDPEALARIEGAIGRRLVTRLRVEEWYGAHGTDAAAPVEGPVLILGLPRTATTAVHYLLAVDDGFRYVRNWEQADPVPPPVLATEQSDPRRPAGNTRGDDVRHISAVDGPTEDNGIHGLHFHGAEMGWPIPTYRTWWRTADLSSTFAYHERVLRLLHSHRPPHRWLLKAPAYLSHVAEFAAHYPDARFLMTHRDPAAAIPSACSVIENARRMMVPSWQADPARLGAEVLGHFHAGMQQAMAARAALGDERFLDVGQRDVETDPVGSAQRIYEFLGFPLTDATAAAMREWAAANARGSRGAHVYTAEQYGLTVDGIHEMFADYLGTYAPFCA